MLTGKNTFGAAKLLCSSCNSSLNIRSGLDILMNITHHKFDSINKWFQNWQKEPTTLCGRCNIQQNIVRNMSSCHNFVAFAISVSNIKVSKNVHIQKPDGKTLLLPLKGVVYAGEFHFTARVIDCNKHIWFHDGMITGSKCEKETRLRDLTEKDLSICTGKYAV